MDANAGLDVYYKAQGVLALADFFKIMAVWTQEDQLGGSFGLLLATGAIHLCVRDRITNGSGCKH